MIATSGSLTSLECTRLVFGPGSLGSLQRSPRLPTWFKGHTSKGRGERKGIGKGGVAREGRRRKESTNANSWLRPWAQLAWKSLFTPIFFGGRF